MNKNTVLHINVPNYRSFHLIWAYSSGLINSLGNLTPTAEKLQQNNTFDLDSLSKFVTDKGLAVEEKGSYFIKPFNHSKMAQLLNEKIIDKKLLDGLYKMSDSMPEFGAEIFVNCRLDK